MVPETGVEPVRNFVAADFKSATSTNSVIPAPKPMLRTLSGFRSVQTKKGSLPLPFFLNSGAGDESRTRDLNLGKVALYQLSYSRIRPAKDLNFTQFFGIDKSTLPKKTKNTINTVFEDPFSGVFRRFEAEERL